MEPIPVPVSNRSDFRRNRPFVLRHTRRRFQSKGARLVLCRADFPTPSPFTVCWVECPADIAERAADMDALAATFAHRIAKDHDEAPRD